ncbi:MAG: hypothetical protein ACJA1C_002941 [Crocinitomicaceae bacterium]|jgi:hypothetical protein
MKIIIALALALISFETLSCDVCGGITVSSGEGLLLDNNFHFIGFKQSYSHFKSTHRDHFSPIVSTTHEHFMRSSINGKWQIANKINLQFELPFVVNTQVGEDETRSEKGIGDVNLLCNYVLVNSKNEEKNRSFQFQTGLGLSIPNGRYSHDVWETSNLFPGTGAFKLIARTNTIIKKNKLGFLQENSIAVSGENKFGYKYGLALASRNSVFLQLKTKKSRLITPSVGISYLYTSTDRINGAPVSQLFNSGHSVNAEMSLNYLTKKWMFILRASRPVYQYIGDGDVKLLGALDIGIYYLIQKK